MKKIFSILIALALVLSFSLVAAVPAAAQDPATLDVSKWTEYAENSIFGQGVDSGPKAYYPSVLYDVNEFSGHGHSAKYKMWYGTSGAQTALATSGDGINWTDQGVVMTNGYHAVVEYYPDGFTGANSGDNPSSATMYYRMWYWDGPGMLYVEPVEPEPIRYAESPDGFNWFNDQAITGNLFTGVPLWGEWNRTSYGPIDVLYNPTATNTGPNPFDYSFVMYFDATDLNFEEIGLGYSSDGRNWNLYGKVLPRGNDGPHGNTDDWDSCYASFGTVIKEDGGKWHMWYSGGTSGVNHGIGHATSTDGLTWTRDANNPIFHKDDGVSWRAERSYCPMVIEVDGVYKMWFSGKDASGNYALGYATNTNPDPDYVTIQAAIDAADPYDTISVAAGTYDEQVVIDKSLTLQGAGDTTIIQPDNEDKLTKIETAPWISGTLDMAAIVWADAPGLSVTIKDLKVDGVNVDAAPAGLASSGRIAGIAYIETSGTVDDVTVVNMQTSSMTPRSTGIWASDDTNAASTVEVKHCTVTNYNRGGIYGCGDYLTVDFNHNTVTGPGVSGVQVPNGIFFLAGIVGSATYNTVTACGYSGDQYRGTGIGTYDAGNNIVIAHNTITDLQNAIALHNSHYGTIEYNTITGSHTGVRPETGSDYNVIVRNDILNNTYAIRMSSTIGDNNEAHFNNFVGNTGTGQAGYEAAVSHYDTGGGPAHTLDAENNWWGSVTGPSVQGPGTGDGVGLGVDYDPWLGEQYAPTKSTGTATGTGTASFTSSAGNIEGLTAVATPPGALVLPHGVFSFNVTGLTSGQTITITIVLPGPMLPLGAKWWKYHAGLWYSLPIGSDDGDNTITITLTDGVFPGDADSIPGQITDPGGPGYVVSSPAGCRLDISSTEGGSVTTPGEGAFPYVCGTVVDLVASPDAGYKFVNWTGEVHRIADVNAAETTVTVHGNYKITANFDTEENPGGEEYTLTISSTAGGSVTSPSEGTSDYEAGTVVNLVASPDDRYEFVSWIGDSITHPDFATTTVTMNGDYSIAANFEEITTTDSTKGPSGSLGCFIATAAYGTPIAEQIDVLREFRDVVLLESTVGSQFVALYYQLSPPIADFISGSSFLRTLVRELLVDPVVWVVEATGDIWRN